MLQKQKVKLFRMLCYKFLEQKNIFSPTLPFITYLISYFTYSHTGSQRLLLFTKITVKIWVNYLHFNMTVICSEVWKADIFTSLTRLFYNCTLVRTPELNIVVIREPMQCHQLWTARSHLNFYLPTVWKGLRSNHLCSMD